MSAVTLPPEKTAAPVATDTDVLQWARQVQQALTRAKEKALIENAKINEAHKNEITAGPR